MFHAAEVFDTHTARTIAIVPELLARIWARLSGYPLDYIRVTAPLGGSVASGIVTKSPMVYSFDGDMEFTTRCTFAAIR